jgi:hypothetical protein
MTPCEMPAACASRDMLPTKVWKSPPHWAAKVGVAAKMETETSTFANMRAIMMNLASLSLDNDDMALASEQ